MARMHKKRSVRIRTESNQQKMKWNNIVIKNTHIITWLTHTNKIVEVNQRMRLPPTHKWKQIEKRLVSQPLETTGKSREDRLKWCRRHVLGLEGVFLPMPHSSITILHDFRRSCFWLRSVYTKTNGIVQSCEYAHNFDYLPHHNVNIRLKKEAFHITSILCHRSLAFRS
jgi:hypothetical protein